MKKRSKIIYWGLVFFVGCFLGWIYEECFSIIIEHQLVNRGFFYGCYLPVYGSGSVILLLLLRNLKMNRKRLKQITIYRYVKKHCLWQRVFL